MLSEPNLEIVNPDGLNSQFILEEIRDLEDTTGRKVKRIEFHDQGDGKCKEIIDWWPVSFQRVRKITHC